MKIAILQLSDIHLQPTRKFAINRISGIVAATCGADNDWQQLLILITGDIAYSGKKEEYKIAEHL